LQKSEDDISLTDQDSTYELLMIKDAKLSGGKYFSKLNFSQAYLQLQLDDDSMNLVTVNTHRGLYQYHSYLLESQLLQVLFKGVLKPYY